MSPNMPPNGMQPTGSLFRALRGPVMMMTLGGVLAFDHFSRFDFGDTWPILLIVFGLMTLGEHLAGRSSSPYAGGPQAGGGL